MARPILILDFDAAWPRIFKRLRDRAWVAVGDFALAIEHVGSTAVPGLAGKSTIDMDVVVPSPQEIELAIERLTSLGYRHRGNLGIQGREAFASPPDDPAHHLYMCPEDSPVLKNHLGLRDYPRIHPEAVEAYAALKRARFAVPR